MNDTELTKVDYSHLVSQISETFVQGQQKAVLAVNTHLVETYWKIGQYIVEYEQGGSGKAEYGKRLLEQLSKDLSLLHGKGFGVSNIYRMRQFFLTYPILAELPQKLSWTHCVELFSCPISNFQTLFSPYLFNKTTLVANNYITPSLKPYYLIRSFKKN